MRMQSPKPSKWGWAVSIQVITLDVGLSVFGGAVNLLMCDQWRWMLEGWTNTVARLAGWRRVAQKVWFCTWWTVQDACPDEPPYHLPRSGAAQLQASGDTSCCSCWYITKCTVYKTPTWWKSHMAWRVVSTITHTASLCVRMQCTLLDTHRPTVSL